jgi:hypothetical protein
MYAVKLPSSLREPDLDHIIHQDRFPGRKSLHQASYEILLKGGMPRDPGLEQGTMYMGWQRT